MSKQMGFLTDVNCLKRRRDRMGNGKLLQTKNAVTEGT